MYSAYLRERENKEILQSDKGFAIYGYNCVPGLDFPHCYIQEIYCKAEHRKSGEARRLADQISEQAKASGFKIIVGSVDGNAKGSHESLLVLIAYGMKLFTISGTLAWFSKEL